jgi:hypothetical protein
MFTIGICYAFAVKLGHVQPFPKTDITHCAMGGIVPHHWVERLAVREREIDILLVLVPERYLFRIGMIPACVGMIYMWYLARTWIEGQEKILAPPKGSPPSEYEV